MKIGIDIGGSHIATGIVVEKGKLLGKETRDINISEIKTQDRVKEIIIDIIENEIKILLDRYDYEETDISKIGIAVPGNPSETEIKNVVNLHIKKFELAKILSLKYNTKVKIKNDGKCAGLAEKEYGNMKQYDDCVFLCIGTGVGSAVFLKGELLEPKQNSGFELGHIVIDKNGIKCNCGNKGCFERYASMKIFKEQFIKEFGMKKNTESEEIQNYIRKNIKTKKVEQFVDSYLENVAIGISNIINIFEPEAICFGGSFSYYDDIFLPRLNEKIKEHIFNKDSKFKLMSAKLKNDAGIIGATQI